MGSRLLSQLFSGNWELGMGKDRNVEGIFKCGGEPEEREGKVHHLNHKNLTMIKIALYSHCKNLRDQVLSTSVKGL